MTGITRLIAAGPEDLDAISRKAIKKGILKSEFLRGPQRCRTKAGFQPLGSGPHYVKDVPIIAQFSTELLSKILGHLDPIWLFQLEIAQPEVCDFLINPAANSLWYNVLPAALMTQPDFFQIEFEASKAQNKGRWDGSVAERYNATQYRRPLPTPLDTTLHHFLRKGDSLELQICLPELTSVTSLRGEDERIVETKHPTYLALHYPFVQPRFSTLRKRNLALGGVYENHINYRRELLGHAHNGHRCYVCYECFDMGSLRLIYLRFGMHLCSKCLTELTLTHAVIKDIYGLHALIQRKKNVIWGSDRLTGTKQHGFWKAQVDDILRKAIGIDFKTAIQKQQYFKYLLDIKTDVCEPYKRKLRNKIVEEAKVQWKANQNLATNPAEVDGYRNSFAPARALGRLLFNPRLLDEVAAYDPKYASYTKSGMYLLDPTESLTTPAQILACLESKEWISGTARNMLILLLTNKKRLTIFCALAHNYHVDRLRASFTVERLLVVAGILDTKYPVMGYSRRLFVTLSKMHLLPDHITAGITLTPKGAALAKAALPKLMAAACVGCPWSNQLVPRGLDALVDHMRRRHPNVFWSGDWYVLG